MNSKTDFAEEEALIELNTETPESRALIRKVILRNGWGLSLIIGGMFAFGKIDGDRLLPQTSVLESFLIGIGYGLLLTAICYFFAYRKNMPRGSWRVDGYGYTYITRRGKKTRFDWSELDAVRVYPFSVRVQGHVIGIIFPDIVFPQAKKIRSKTMMILTDRFKIASLLNNQIFSKRSCKRIALATLVAVPVILIYYYFIILMMITYTQPNSTLQEYVRDLAAFPLPILVPMLWGFYHNRQRWLWQSLPSHREKE